MLPCKCTTPSCNLTVPFWCGASEAVPETQTPPSDPYSTWPVRLPIPVSVIIGSGGAIGGFGLCGCAVVYPSNSCILAGVSNPSKRLSSALPDDKLVSVAGLAMRECEGSGRCTVQCGIMTMLCSPWVVWGQPSVAMHLHPSRLEARRAEAVRVETSRCTPSVEPSSCWDQTTSFTAATPFTPEPDCRESSQGPAARIIDDPDGFVEFAEACMQPTIW